MPSKSMPRRLTLVLQFLLFVGLAGAIWEQQWLNAVITTGIIIITLFPILLAKKFNVHVPSVFQLMAIGFIFASIFLGEVHGYYTKFWWWDIALHTTSGFLLGITGFLLVYLMNENDSIHMHMQPGFVAFFAFMFALGMGALWEIFEFSMDQIFGTNMQKPMFSDDSGLTDTMYDLIVDAIGALIISVLGYGYLKKAEAKSFLERWIWAFIVRNPRFFNKNKKSKHESNLPD
ncbi:hypothetical protein E8Q33_00965 [Methylophaga sp. SB9B]|uniref:hypothetical protein n=1 Tax=Methylophaga sp. SB9B TaxID=2570356 RepID=UPI0010A7F165|nr:hypothetical protein [Methylophaga sp. SB9B]THK43221.1 hypothetical protein E8Q33_00965 [Methylophaga sp. SB9B]